MLLCHKNVLKRKYRMDRPESMRINVTDGRGEKNYDELKHFIESYYI